MPSIKTILQSMVEKDTASSKNNPRIVQNFRLIWLDSYIDVIHNNDAIYTMAKLREVVNTVEQFTDIDRCIEFISDIADEKIFLIISGTIGQTIMPVIHSMPQTNCIYVFCHYKEKHESWANQWSKIKGVYTTIKPICEALKQAGQECDHNSISMNFNTNLDNLDQSFMYTQLLKEIILTIDFDQKHFHEFLTYCREQFIGNTTELENIDKIEREYRDHEPIWWYTYDCFLYSMLNRVLRLMEIDLIIKMGFFIRDLYNHIARLHDKQYGRQSQSNSFIVYRGQGLFQTDFDQLQNAQGGLLSFNNFLSASTNRDVSVKFAWRTIAKTDLVGVLFVMKIDSSISATPFANVNDISYYKGEEEILFSMHSVFRIGQIQQIREHTRLWRVNLTLTNEIDPQLYDLMKSIQRETKGSTGWDRLGILLTKLDHFNTAEELFGLLLEQTNDEGEKAHLYHMLGIVKRNQGDYTGAIKFHENSIKIKQKILPPTHSDLATSYNCLGLAYDNMEQYSKALSYYEKDLEICQKSLPHNHPDLGTSYNNIGSMYSKMGEYSKALSYYEKALDIYQKALPANHPHLATSYGNIGLVYSKMGEYSKALSYNEKALEIKQKTLPANHSSLAKSYNNMGNSYYYQEEYSEALLYYERALDIFQRSLPSNHPDIATVKESMEIVKNKL